MSIISESGYSFLPDMTAQLIDRKDMDGNGTIGAEEFVGEAAGDFEEIFNRIDTSGDGQLDEEELNIAYMNAAPQLQSQALMGFFDNDSDTQLGVEETSLGNDLFEEIDSDGDNVVVLDELLGAFTDAQSLERAEWVDLVA